MNRRRRVYEGKAKILYEGPEPGTLVQHFKDDATVRERYPLLSQALVSGASPQLRNMGDFAKLTGRR